MLQPGVEVGAPEAAFGSSERSGQGPRLDEHDGARDSRRLAVGHPLKAALAPDPMPVRRATE
jgi:hypothetical protein